MIKKLDPSKLTIGLKPDILKDAVVKDLNAVELAVQKIHAADENKKDRNGKNTKRITLDIEKPLHRRIAMHLLDKDVTFKDYFLQLAIKDLENEAGI